jgi:multidrug efflux pump subunit AcrA (membrane-fusion protein)
MKNPPSNSDDIIDSRDIIARIEELTGYKDALDAAREALTEAQTAADAAQKAFDENEDAEQYDALNVARDDAELAATDAEGKVDVAEVDFGDEEQAELAALEALQGEADGYLSGWRDGVTLIRDSHFEEHAREFAEDIGAIPANAPWPCTCIDWKKAAKVLQQEYTSVSFDGVDYWIRQEGSR